MGIYFSRGVILNNTEPIINADRLSAEAMYEKKRLFTDCVKLSVLLILYNLLNRIFSYVFFYGAYFYHSGKFTFSYGKVISYLRQQREFVSSTVFNMTANLFITLCSFVLIFIVYSLLFRGRIKAYLSPGVKKGALGLKWFPACFVINILLTQFMLILTGILGANGVSVPTSDFSIKQPSTAAVIMQLLYVVIIAPFIEEFIYRGIILSALAPYGQGAAVLFSALAFGLMHGNIPQAASAFATGLVYAVIAVKCGSILPTVIIHCLNNLTANFSTLATAMGISGYETVLSMVEIFIGLLGFLVLFTNYKRLYLSKQGCALTSAQSKKTVFTNPAVIIYFICLIIPIIESLIAANFFS